MTLFVRIIKFARYDGERKKVHILTSNSGMGEFERINDEPDKNDKIMETTINLPGTGEEDRPFTDHFYRSIQQSSTVCLSCLTAPKFSKVEIILQPVSKKPNSFYTGINTDRNAVFQGEDAFQPYQF